MNEPAHTVEIRLNEDDIAALSDYYYRHTPRGRRRNRILKTTPLLVAGVWAWTVRNHPEWGMQDPARYALYAGIGAVMIVLAGWVGIWYIRPTLARMSVRFGNRRKVLEPFTLGISREQIDIANEHGKGKATWDHVSHVGRTDTHGFILFLGPNGFVIPKRCFASDAAFTAFCNAAREFHRR